MVSFGLAPAVLAHFLIVELLPGGNMEAWGEWRWWEQAATVVPLLIPAFSAYRLAKFNLDARQAMSFIGMPTPAHALFWVGLVLGRSCEPELYALLFGHAAVLGICVVILSVLLVSELPMFSLKIAGFGWRENKVRYLYFAVLVACACIWGGAVLFLVVPLYLLFSLGAFFINQSRQ